MENLELLEELKKSINQLKKSKAEKILGILDKILIPLFLGLLTYSISYNNASVKESQLELAELQNDWKLNESRANIQLKYVELFYNDFSTKDTSKQKNALKLLELIDADLATPIKQWIRNNNSYPSIKNEVSTSLENQKLPLIYDLFNPIRKKREIALEALQYGYLTDKSIISNLLKIAKENLGKTKIEIKGTVNVLYLLDKLPNDIVKKNSKEINIYLNMIAHPGKQTSFYIESIRKKF